MNILENLELTDIITFGKYKKRIVEDIYKDDCGYLVWLREERRTKNGQSNFFSDEVNTLLDMTIQESKPLKAKYKTWQALGLFDKPNTESSGKTPPWEEDAPTEERAVEYTAWGAF